MAKDPNPTCCYKADVVTRVVETRVAVETVKKEVIAECPNCGKLKDKIQTEYVAYGA